MMLRKNARKEEELHDIAAKCMNIQEVFAKVSSSIESQTKSVNSATYELHNDQSANCSVHTGLILDTQNSSSFKTIAPPSVSKLSLRHQVKINL